MNVTCSATPCPVILDSTCVFYEGPNLICSGINTNDNLETIIEKLDAAVCGAGLFEGLGEQVDLVVGLVLVAHQEALVLVV